MNVVRNISKWSVYIDSFIFNEVDSVLPVRQIEI